MQVFILPTIPSESELHLNKPPLSVWHRPGWFNTERTWVQCSELSVGLCQYVRCKSPRRAINSVLCRLSGTANRLTNHVCSPNSASLLQFEAPRVMVLGSLFSSCTEEHWGHRLLSSSNVLNQNRANKILLLLSSSNVLKHNRADEYSAADRALTTTV